MAALDIGVEIWDRPYRDHGLMGIILDLLMAAPALWLIPNFWPLTAP